MTLREKQSLFCRLIADLIRYANAQGYQLTFGEVYRSPEEVLRLAQIGKGIKASLHAVRLAVDFNLFIGGAYQAETAAYRPLGEWWEQQSGSDYQCCWGGRFQNGDANHFSISHDGRK